MLCVSGSGRVHQRLSTPEILIFSNLFLPLPLHCFYGLAYFLLDTFIDLFDDLVRLDPINSQQCCRLAIRSI